MVIQPGKQEYAVDAVFRRRRGFPYWTMGALLDGRGATTFGKQTFITQAGHMGLIEPDTPYTAEVAAGSREIWCFYSINKPFVKMIRGWPSMAPGYYHVQFNRSRQGSEIVRLMQELQYMVGSSLPQAALFAENTLERILFLLNQVHTDNTRPPLDERVSGAADFISANFRKPMSLGDIADHVHVSPSRLSHLFHDQTGESPMFILQQHRIQEAIRLLLSTNLRIYEVAEMVGYVNPYHFCVRFKRHTGKPPREFRLSPGSSTASR